MTKLIILTSNERRRFDSPPLFSAEERALYFSLSNEEIAIIQQLRTTTNKIGFTIQLAYFKSNGKFFLANQFRGSDLEYAAKVLGIVPKSFDMSRYYNKTPTQHRKQILALLKWHAFDDMQQKELMTHIKWQVQRQLIPRDVFLSAIDFCWKNKFEVPSYNAITTFITDSYNQFESELINILSNKLTNLHREKLDKIVTIENNKEKKFRRPIITLIKQVNQSLRPSDIQENVQAFQVFKEHYMDFKTVIDALAIPDHATEYFATWVQKSTAFQLNQFANKNKLYLYVLCYIKHQFYFRHDILIDILLKSTQNSMNVAIREFNNIEKALRPLRNKAIKNLSATNKNSRKLIEQITEVLQSSTYSDSGKVSQIDNLIKHYHSEQTAISCQQLQEYENSLDKISKNDSFYDALEKLSLKLQRRVAEIVKIVEFNKDTSNLSIMEAIEHFRLTNSEISSSPPLDFLKTEEKELIYTSTKLRVSLYKSLLFLHMAAYIKSGHLNFCYSYRFKAIHEYMIEEAYWNSNKDELLKQAGLREYCNFDKTTLLLKQQLDSKYTRVNEQFLKGENIYLTIDDKNKLKIITPKTDSDETEYVSSLLGQSGFVPVLQVLSDINKVTEFTGSFRHFSTKHKKMDPQVETIFAGIMGKGCNIGINRIANISVGINEDILSNMVNWCFSLKNIQSANNKILAVTNKLFLANAYHHNKNETHTSSDGRKVNVAVDSIFASYSFKYFGKGKGVTIYTFIDERQLLFHSVVISSSEREAAYVIDGLLQNDVVKSTIHSTDTHGFSELVFAASHFINTGFAPRIKNIADQNLYSFSARKTYERVKDDEEPEEGDAWRAKQPGCLAVEPFVEAASSDAADAGRPRPSAVGGHTSAEIEGERGTGKSRFASREPALNRENRGYKILPSRTINLKLIKNNWDDILRFMATIKLKHSSASQLFKRLSSYAKDHPLYQALKEFGRITKSIFILTYYDDVELRQRIEKQLNKVESSNKFSKAVFFSNNGEFKNGVKEEQQIIVGCKVLIQNAIVLWNYLYLSQLLLNNAGRAERKRMLNAILKGSIVVWHHINMQGEYDFTKHAANENIFDIDKILSLKVA